MNSDGSEQTRLTDDNAYDVMPKWSPDGAEILFESNRGVMNSLYLMSADGTNVRLATNEAQKDGTPGWGNSGQRFYFTSVRTGTWELYFHDLVTGEEKQLTENGGYNRFPVWAPPAE